HWKIRDGCCWGSDPHMKNKADAFDVVVIGGGPAGYPAAIRAAQNQLSVACIDEWKNRDGSAAFGGTCLNAGCIPSKALLESTELYHRVHEEFAVHGIKVSGATLDLAQMQKRKGGIVRGMTQGILALFKAAGVTPLQGHGRLLAGRRIEFIAHDGSRRELSARHVGKLGLDIRLGAKVTGAAVAGATVDVTYEDAKGAQRLAVERLVVAIGRRPYTRDLLGADTGVQLDESGFISVDQACRTGVEGVWAIGDCVRG